MIAAIHFCDGKCTGLAFPDDPGRRTYTVAELASLGLLSFSDRLILDQLAQRVEKLSGQLNRGENAA